MDKSISQVESGARSVALECLVCFLGIASFADSAPTTRLANRSIAHPKISKRTVELVVRKSVVTGAAGLAVRATNLGADARCARREPTAATAADGEVAAVEVALCAAQIGAAGPAAIAAGNSARSGARAGSGRSSARASGRSSSTSSAAPSPRSSGLARRDSDIASTATNGPLTGRSGSPVARGGACGCTVVHAARATVARRFTRRPAAVRSARSARARSRNAGLVSAACREPNRRGRTGDH
jgi:hypothetical protein